MNMGEGVICSSEMLIPPPPLKVHGAVTQKTVLFKYIEDSSNTGWCHNPKDYTLNITIQKSKQKLQ
jgi:hypothetical protein